MPANLHAVIIRSCGAGARGFTDPLTISGWAPNGWRQQRRQSKVQKTRSANKSEGRKRSGPEEGPRFQVRHMIENSKASEAGPKTELSAPRGTLRKKERIACCPRCNGKMVAEGEEGDSACFTCGNVVYENPLILTPEMKPGNRRLSHGGERL